VERMVPVFYVNATPMQCQEAQRHDKYIMKQNMKIQYKLVIHNMDSISKFLKSKSRLRTNRFGNEEGQPTVASPFLSTA
jgi:AAA15 family ATPase/GTPase